MISQYPALTSLLYTAIFMGNESPKEATLFSFIAFMILYLLNPLRSLFFTVLIFKFWQLGQNINPFIPSSPSLLQNHYKSVKGVLSIEVPRRYLKIKRIKNKDGTFVNFVSPTAIERLRLPRHTGG